jgi:hypothetical protein
MANGNATMKTKVEYAREGLLKAIDILHPGLQFDALRLMEAIDHLIVTSLHDHTRVTPDSADAS